MPTVFRKIFEGVILKLEIKIPKTHDLILLANLIDDKIKIEEHFFDEIDWLKQVTIEVRYPRDKINFIPLDTKQAIEIAEKIQKFVLDNIN